MDLDAYRRLIRARELIDDCFDHPLQLNQLSREACFSTYHFLRLFKQAFQLTPHQYLVHKRLEKAKELLQFSSLSVTDVCFEVGFQSLGSFSSLFHRLTGQSPLSYRTRMFVKQSMSHQPAIRIPRCFAIMFGFDSRFAIPESQFRRSADIV
jgi:AraC-like DNA-binding protein